MKTVNYEGYTVREDGKILGKFGKEIGKTNSKGYTYVTVNGKQMLRHRLVWMAFVGVIPEGFEIDHIVPLSKGGTDALSNLRLVTHQENCRNENSKDNYKKSNSVRRKYATEEEAKEANKKQHIVYARQYYLKNKKKCLMQMKQYYQEHKKEKLAYMKQRREENKEHVAQYMKQWRKDNPNYYKFKNK